MNTASLPASASTTLRARAIRRNAWVVAIYVLLAVLLGVEKIIHPGLNSFDIQSLVNGSLPLALAAMAQGAVVLSGGIDLSVGSLMSLINVISALYMVKAGFPEALAIAAVLLIAGAAAGALTGVAITVSRVPDIIVTLATSFIWAGLALQIMGTPGGGAPTQFVDLMTGEAFSVVPSGLLVILAVLLVVWLPFRSSRPGLALYALGSNRNAAYLSGVSVARTRIVAYTLGGVFAALAGLALTANTGNGNALSGTSYTLNSVAAIVLGGISLTGGRGGMLGPIAAAFVLTAVGTILTFLNVDPNYGTVIQGVLVVLVVMFGGFLMRKRR